MRVLVLVVVAVVSAGVWVDVAIAAPLPRLSVASGADNGRADAPVKDASFLQVDDTSREVRGLASRKHQGLQRNLHTDAKRFPGAGLLKKAGGALKSAAKGAVSGAMGALLTRSTKLVFTPARKCVMCEFVVQSADKRLRENPYSDWEGLPDVRPFIDPEDAKFGKPPPVKGSGSGSGRPPSAPPPPKEPGSGSGPELGSSALLAPVTPSVSSNPAQAASFLEASSSSSAAAAGVFHGPVVPEHLTTEYYLRPPEAFPAHAPAAQFDPFPRHDPALLELVAGTQFAPALDYVPTPLGPGGAMRQAPAGVYAPGAAAAHLDSMEPRAAAAWTRHQLMRQHAGLGAGVPTGPAPDPMRFARQPTTEILAESMVPTPDAAAGDGPQLPMYSGGAAGGAQGAPVPGPPRHSAYHGRPAVELEDTTSSSAGHGPTSALASSHHLGRLSFSALDAVSKLRKGLMSIVDSDLGSPLSHTGATPTGSKPLRGSDASTAAADARFSSAHQRTQHGAHATYRSRSSSRSSSSYRRRRNARRYRSDTQYSNKARTRTLNAAASYSPHLPPKPPKQKGKIGKHEEDRGLYRAMYMQKWQKLYHEFMGAMDDTCKTAVPADMQHACRPMFAKAEEIVDMLLHGYATDEICERVKQCRMNFFSS